MKILLIGLLTLTSLSSFSQNQVCQEYNTESYGIEEICADMRTGQYSENVIILSDIKLISDNGTDWSIGKGLFPSKRAFKICQALGIHTTELVLGYKIELRGQEQANLNLKGKTSISLSYEAITEVTCLKE